MVPPSPLDAFIPKPDIRERHEVVVNASPAVTMAAAEKLDINSLPLVRAIFRLRAWFMQATRPDFKHQPFMDELRGLGWRELARGRDRFFVMGAVTQPWLGDVTFMGIEPSRFAEFAEPDLVKIAWTIETIPMGDGRTLHRTETRVIATDDAARQKFRRYWRWAGFGIVAIRLLIVPAIRRNAERAARRAHTRSFDPAHRRT